jgi:hypothetical protein
METRPGNWKRYLNSIAKTITKKVREIEGRRRTERGKIAK